MEKPKIAFYWCASCGGCEEMVLDVGERILEITDAVDIVFWPVALDFKKHDIEAMRDGSIIAAFINGAIRTSEQEEMARLIRRKAQVVFAVGSCAHLGGIPGLANLYPPASILEAAYGPEYAPAPNLPRFYSRVKTLDAVIPVEYYIPGCPPTPELFVDAVRNLLHMTLPEPGAVLAPDRALCDECPRRDTRPEMLRVERFRRPHQFIADQQTCLLAQGLACMGPATRSGCGSRCIHGNMPCTGCFGPTSRVRDFGAKALSAIASTVAAKDEEALAGALAEIPDPAGLFYRYSLPSSTLVPRR